MSVDTSRDSLQRMLAAIQLGGHGVINVFDRQRRLLLQHPESVPAASAGDLPSRALLAATPRPAPYRLEQMSDGRARIVSVRQVGHYPLFVMVALAEEDYLRPWWRECLGGGVFIALSLLVSVALVLALRFFARAQQLQQQMQVTQAAYDHLAALLKAIPDLLFELDGDGVYLDYRALDEQLLVAPARSFIGRRVADVLPPEAAAKALAALEQAKLDGVSYGTQICLNVPAGEHWFELSVARKSDSLTGETSYLVLSRDISERKHAEIQIEQLAFSDSLTRLPNRRVFIDRLQQCMATSERSLQYCALFFLDLDKFKVLNDTRGHQLGDRLLVLIAERLRHAVRAGDTVARLGGDEFVVILEQLGELQGDASARAMTVADKIGEQLRAECDLDGKPYRSSCSIGIALFRGHETTSDELLKRADLAMYQAKAAGRNTVRFFDPQTQANIEARMALEADLQRAVFNDEFVLHYQPQIDSAGRCVGAEALVRWQSASLGHVSPASFIPLAEETGLILPIGHRVLSEACKRLQQWQHVDALAGITLAVNVSPRQFELPTFVEEVRQLIDYYRINPARLKLELTESMLIDRIDEAVAKMRLLRDIGIQFSLDDFGTGFSCLSYLKRLPFSQIKIDQSFARDVLTDANDAAICRAIIALGRSLGLEVIAEGVETLPQWDFFKAEGCRRAQGYLIGRPMPVEAFEAWAQQSVGA